MHFCMSLIFGIIEQFISTFKEAGSSSNVHSYVSCWTKSFTVAIWLVCFIYLLNHVRFHFVLLPNQDTYMYFHTWYIGHNADKVKRQFQILKHVLKPFMLRRTKAFLVASGCLILPPLTFMCSMYIYFFLLACTTSCHRSLNDIVPFNSLVPLSSFPYNFFCTKLIFADMIFHVVYRSYSRNFTSIHN